MDTKLTLKLDESVIVKAKEYAKNHQTSLSRLVENYLQQITRGTPETLPLTPLVRSLSGVLDLPADFDAKKDYTDHLAEKYR
ncbi:MAG: hypothetical protein KJS92_09100 [Bacteroidetes bacterium]|nr:hypothetical protein [Bacteroidota bacterium]